MNRPVVFVIEEREAPTEEGGRSRVVELRLSFDSDAVAHAAYRAVPVACALGARRHRVASTLSGGASALRSGASKVVPAVVGATEVIVTRVMPAVGRKAAGITGGVALGVGIAAYKVASDMRRRAGEEASA